MSVYCGAFRHRHLMNCLLFVVLLLLSFWHLCVSSDLASQIRVLPFKMGLTTPMDLRRELAATLTRADEDPATSVPLPLKLKHGRSVSLTSRLGRKHYGG